MANKPSTNTQSGPYEDLQHPLRDRVVPYRHQVTRMVIPGECLPALGDMAQFWATMTEVVTVDPGMLSMDACGSLSVTFMRVGG